MADSVLFVGWNRPVSGREARAVELFSSFVNYLGKQQGQGNIENFEPVFLNVHGGDMNGFILIRGDRTKLGNLRHANEWLDLTTQCSINVEGFGVVDGWTGEGVKGQLTRYTNYIK